MHPRLLLSLGVGLSSLGLAVGSVCRPRTTGPSVSTVETSTVVSRATGENLATSTPFDTSPVSTTEAATETSYSEAEAITTGTATDSTTETLETTVTEAISTDSWTTATTTVAETTTSESLPYPTAFNIVASTGLIENKVLKGRSTDGAYVLFNGAFGQDLTLSYEPETGRLRASDSLYICASYNYELRTASLTTCEASRTSLYVKCDAPTGESLQCRMPACTSRLAHEEQPPFALVVITECDPDAAPWTQFYTRIYQGNTRFEWHADIGAEDASDSSLTPIDLRIVGI